VPAEFLDTDQELHRRGAQLRDEFPCPQERAQRNQYRADPGERNRDLHPADTIGHNEPNPGAFADTGFDEHCGQIARGDVQFVVAEPTRGVGYHRFDRGTR
jgi:hypothetical protein